MNIKQINASSIPMALLLEADPSEKCIQSYLENSLCFGMFEDNKLLGACVTNSISSDTCEIYNIALFPEFQKQGLGTRLLKTVLGELFEKGVKEVALGTGTFGHQLTFYQRLGFRVDSVRKNFFINNYEEPIYENGLQHIDMLRLSLKLAEMTLD